MFAAIFFLFISVIIFGGGYLFNKLYFNGPTCELKKKLYGKVAIVTGADTGIGYETAKEFAKRGATVILACHDFEKAYKACGKLVIESRNEKVFADRLDLSDLESIQCFAERFMLRFDRLDILVNNAGTITRNHQKTLNGFEMNFGTMHLGHFYLTNLLLDYLKKSAPSRVLNVSCEMHRGVNIRWNDIQLEKNYDPFFAYRQAKLANILFTLELSKRLEGTNVCVVSINPGLIRNELSRNFKRVILQFRLRSLLYASFLPTIWLCSRTSKQGAQTVIYCALVDDLPSGKYFADCQVSKCSKQAQDEQAAKRLWELSAKLVNLE